MGVNLKELGLMLIILIAIGAGLVIYFLNTQAKREGESFVRNTNDAVLNATSKNDNYKKKNSIAVAVKDKLNGTSLNGVPVKFFTGDSIEYTYGVNGEDIYNWTVNVVMFSGAAKNEGGTYAAGTDTIDGSAPGIFLAIVPRKSVTNPSGVSDNVVLLKPQAVADKGGTDVLTGNKFEALTPAQKGYVGEAFLVYGAFDKEDDAKAFRDKYFPSANIFQDNNGGTDGLYYIAVESGF